MVGSMLDMEVYRRRIIRYPHATVNIAPNGAPFVGARLADGFARSTNERYARYVCSEYNNRTILLRPDYHFGCPRELLLLSPILGGILH